MTGSEVRFKNGVEYNFDHLSNSAQNHGILPRKKQGRDANLLQNLREQKQQLLKKIETWQCCPKLYRRQLYKRLHNIDLSKKEANARLDEMRRELDMLSFNLQLNPKWVRGLLKLIDEILDQTKPDQRHRLIIELDLMKKEFGALKHKCNLYQIDF